MTDKPILFNGPMVRAIIDGRKTQTRRPLTSRSCTVDGSAAGHIWNQLNFDAATTEDKSRLMRAAVSSAAPRDTHLCARDHARDTWHRVRPKIEIGDRLWVRETWAVTSLYDGMRAHEINPDGIPLYCGIRYAATQSRSGIADRPSIHMPRWASRLTLVVTDVRVQRLQDISEDEAKAEGLSTVSKDGKLWKWGIADSDGLPGNDDFGWHWRDWKTSPLDAFAKLWDSMYAKRGQGREENPWVCAITFDVHKRNIDQMDRNDD
jgi:hypothetical protein